MLLLAGEVDAVVVDAFDRSAAALPGAQGGSAFTVVDVSELTFIDCAGLGFLVPHTGTSDGRSARPTLLQAPVALMRILGVTGVTGLFDFDTRRRGESRDDGARARVRASDAVSGRCGRGSGEDQ
jgi:anti-anti-sigma factor